MTDTNRIQRYLDKFLGGVDVVKRESVEAIIEANLTALFALIIDDCEAKERDLAIVTSERDTYEDELTQTRSEYNALMLQIVKLQQRLIIEEERKAQSEQRMEQSQTQMSSTQQLFTNSVLPASKSDHSKKLKGMLYVDFSEEDADYMAKKVEEKFNALCDKLEQISPWSSEKNKSTASSWNHALNLYALREWTAAGFLHIQYLWDGTILRHREKKAVAFLFLITYLIDSLKIGLPTDTVLLRGIQHNPELWNRMLQHSKDGTLFESHGFASCTYLEEWMLRNKANDRFRFVMVISIPQGFGMTSMTPFSQYGEKEGELIFPFNTSFKITKVDVDNKFVYMNAIANPSNPLPRHFYVGEETDIVTQIRKSLEWLGAGMDQFSNDEIRELQTRIGQVCPTCPPQTKTKLIWAAGQQQYVEEDL